MRIDFSVKVFAILAKLSVHAASPNKSSESCVCPPAECECLVAIQLPLIIPSNSQGKSSRGWQSCSHHITALLQPNPRAMPGTFWEAEVISCKQISGARTAVLFSVRVSRTAVDAHTLSQLLNLSSSQGRPTALAPILGWILHPAGG